MLLNMDGVGQYCSTEMTTTQSNDKKGRWQTNHGKQLAQEVWRRLAGGESLRDLAIPEYEARLDLRGISVPEVTKEELPPFRNWGLHKLHGPLEFRNVHFDGIDFTGSDLAHVQFFNSKITECRFDGALCGNWGVRAADIIRTSFVDAKLRDAVLGPWYQGRGNRYQFVDFSRADMRGLISTTATYVDCNFSHARLDKIDFQSSSFIRCRFAGEVREVLFYDNAFDPRKKEANPMEDVDFSQAQLRWVAFRRLNLDRVRLPENRDHLVLKNYPCVLRKALAAVKDDESLYGRGLTRVLGNDLKWVGPNQQIGVLNRLDFLEVWGAEGEIFAVELLRRAEQECLRLQ